MKTTQFHLYTHMAYIIISATMLMACSTEAKFSTEDVTITCTVHEVSAGLIECNFSTSKDSYYFIDCIPAHEGVNPMNHQKQFMLLALDSADYKYREWRYWLLSRGEFNIAPFSSYALQYGSTHKVFTKLHPNTDYWVFYFVVDPETQHPTSRLGLQTIRTTEKSTIEVHFDYRVNGVWDYIYPRDEKGNILNNYPFIGTTLDSTGIAKEGYTNAVEYFKAWLIADENHEDRKIFNGIIATKNDGTDGHTTFKEGEVYYTCFAGLDGGIVHPVLYSFRWTGYNFSLYIQDNEENNLFNQ